MEKIIAAVSRIIESGNRMVFDSPEVGSYIENKVTTEKTYLRQENGVY